VQRRCQMTVTTTVVSRQQRRVLPLTPPSAVERASGEARLVGLPLLYISIGSREVLCVTAVLLTVQLQYVRHGIAPPFPLL